VKRVIPVVISEFKMLWWQYLIYGKRKSLLGNVETRDQPSGHMGDEIVGCIVGKVIENDLEGEKMESAYAGGSFNSLIAKVSGDGSGRQMYTNRDKEEITEGGKIFYECGRPDVKGTNKKHGSRDAITTEGYDEPKTELNRKMPSKI
ncbi:17100_t:CDS:2, partial [Dentiscutata erythropus]